MLGTWTSSRPIGAVVQGAASAIPAARLQSKVVVGLKALPEGRQPSEHQAHRLIQPPDGAMPPYFARRNGRARSCKNARPPASAALAGPGLAGLSLGAPVLDVHVARSGTHGLAIALPELGGALDVGPEEGDGAARKLWH